MDWIKVSKGVVETIQKYMNDTDGWKQVKKSVSHVFFSFVTRAWTLNRGS